MKLHGPANPDQLRVKVGYYRHYFDNLPACDIAPATDATWPAVSSIKNAAGKDWSYTTMRRIAVDLAANPTKHEGRSEEAIYNDLVALNKTELNRAQGRGTDVHSLFEAKAFGGDVMLSPDAEQYRDVVDQFLNDCQPDFFLSEVVVINRALGYGGTGDAWVVINHPDFGRLLVDWKTRTSATKHAAYDEECWQVGGAYFHGEYMIIEEDGQARRAPMPELDGAAIVSLAPESYKIIPIDVERSWDAFQALYAFWAAKAPPFSGKPLYVKRSTPAPVDPELVDKLRAEILWIKEAGPLAAFTELAGDWPDGVPTFTKGGPTNADQTALLAMLVERIKRDHNVPFNPADNPPPAPIPEKPAPLVEVQAAPDEGGDVELGDRDALAKALAALPEPEQAWVGYIAKQAHDAGAGISVKQRPSVRRFEIARGLIHMAPHGEDELLRALVALAVNDDSLTSPALPAGAVVASLGAVEAAAFAALCEQYAAGGLPTVVGQDNRLRVQRAA